MPWLLEIAWPFIKTYKTVFFYGFLVMLTWIMLAYWGHTKYEAGKEVGVKIATAAKMELQKEKKAHEFDIQNYRATQAVVDADNKKEVARLNKIIEDIKKKYDAEHKKLLAKQKEREANVDTQIPPKLALRIVAPVDFRLLYNAAVSDYPGYTGPKSDEAYSTGTIGKIESLDANSTTKIINGNIYKYNELALKCDKLIDLVKENEQTSNSP